MHKPVLEHQVMEGGAYWAAWGDKGWSAVKIISKKRKNAVARRVKPNTGAVIRETKVRLDRLVKRNPELKGKDRPKETPAEVFAPKPPPPAPPPILPRDAWCKNYLVPSLGAEFEKWRRANLKKKRTTKQAAKAKKWVKKWLAKAFPNQVGDDDW